MNQSAVLVATLAAAFVLFLAARGRLAVYGKALLGPTGQGGQGGGQGGSSGDVMATVGQAAGTAATVAKVAMVFA